MVAALREQSLASGRCRASCVVRGVEGRESMPTAETLLKRSASSFRSAFVDMRPKRGLDFSSVHVMISPHLAVGSDASLVYPLHRCEK
jgi:hypothetical protein